MATRMARITSGTVTNIEFWGDTQTETSTLKYIGDKPVSIGDFYRNDKFYHGEEEVLSPLEKENQELVQALGEATEALYEFDLSILEV